MYHLVINALEEKGFGEKRRGAITLQKPGELLDLWAQNYSLEQHRRHTFYTFARDPRALAAKLSAHALAHREQFALTLHSGAALVAPFVRTGDVHAYFVGDVERLVTLLDLRPVESGGTVHLFEPAAQPIRPNGMSTSIRNPRLAMFAVRPKPPSNLPSNLPQMPAE